MSKTSKRKSSESGKQSDNRNPSSTKDTSVVKRQSVFERLGTKATSSRASSERALSINTSIPEAFCRSWALNGTCSHDKSCKLAHSHTLISPSKRSSIKKDCEIVHVSGVDKNRLVSSVKHQAPDVGAWDSFDQIELEYEDEKVLEKRRAALQRELELQMKKDGSRKEVVKARRSSSTSSLSSTSSVSSSSSTSSRSSVSVAKKTADKKRHLASSSPESEKKKLAMKGSSHKGSPPRKMSSSSSRDQDRSKGRSGASSPLRQLQSRKRSISPPRKPSPKTKGSSDPYKGITLEVTLKNDLALRAGNPSRRKESPSSLRRGTSSDRRSRRSSSRSRRRSPVVARPTGSRRSRPRSPSRPSTSSRARTPERKKEDERKKDDRRDRKIDPREKKPMHDDSRSRDKARGLAREKERLEALERCRERQREREKEKDRLRDDRDRKDVKRPNRDISRSSTVSSDKRHERAYDRFDRSKGSDRDRSYDERERVRDRALERMMERKSVDRNRERSRDRYADRGNYSDSRRILPPEEKNYSASPYRSGERSRYEPERERLSPRDERLNRSGYSDDRRDRGRSRGWPEGQQSSQSSRYDEPSREREKPPRSSGGGEWASDRGSDFQESGSGRSRDWESSRIRDEGGDDWAGYDRGPTSDWHNRQHSHHHHIDDRRDRRHGSGSKEKDAHPPIDAAKNQDSMESLGKRSAVEDSDEPIKRARLSEPPALEELSDISDDDDILNRVDPEFTEGEDSRMGDSSQAAMCDTSSGQGERTDTHMEDSMQAPSPKLGEDENMVGLDFEEISDEELEEESKVNKGGSVGDALGVDWASLMAECRPPKKKPEETGENGVSSVRARWEASGILSRLSVSTSLASPEYLKKLKEKFPQAVPGCRRKDQDHTGDASVVNPGTAVSGQKKECNKKNKEREGEKLRQKKNHHDEDHERKQRIQKIEKKNNNEENEDSSTSAVGEPTSSLNVPQFSTPFKNPGPLGLTIPATSYQLPTGGMEVVTIKMASPKDCTHAVEADAASDRDEPPMLTYKRSKGTSLKPSSAGDMADSAFSAQDSIFTAPPASSTRYSPIATKVVPVSDKPVFDFVPIHAGPSNDIGVSNVPPAALDDNAMDGDAKFHVDNVIPVSSSAGTPSPLNVPLTPVFTTLSSSEFGKILTDLTISSIRQQPALWDRSHPHFFKRKVRSSLLTEIASTLGITVQTLRTRWSNLKLAYKRNYLKYVNTGVKSVSRNYEAMSFLECEIKRELRRINWDGNSQEVTGSPTVRSFENDEGLTQDRFNPLNFVAVEMGEVGTAENSPLNRSLESGMPPSSRTSQINLGRRPDSSVMSQDENSLRKASYRNIAEESMMNFAAEDETKLPVEQLSAQIFVWDGMPKNSDELRKYSIPNTDPKKPSCVTTLKPRRSQNASKKQNGVRSADQTILGNSNAENPGNLHSQYLNPKPDISSEKMRISQNIFEIPDQSTGGTSTISRDRNPLGEASSSKTEKTPMNSGAAVERSAMPTKRCLFKMKPLSSQVDIFSSIRKNWNELKLPSYSLKPKPPISTTPGAARKALPQNGNGGKTNRHGDQATLVNSNLQNTENRNSQYPNSAFKMPSKIVEVAKNILNPPIQRPSAIPTVHVQHQLTPATLSQNHNGARYGDQTMLENLHPKNTETPNSQYHNYKLKMPKCVEVRRNVFNLPVQRTGANSSVQARQQSASNSNRAAVPTKQCVFNVEQLGSQFQRFTSTPKVWNEIKSSNSNLKPKPPISIIPLEAASRTPSQNLGVRSGDQAVIGNSLNKGFGPPYSQYHSAIKKLSKIAVMQRTGTSVADQAQQHSSSNPIAAAVEKRPAMPPKLFNMERLTSEIHSFSSTPKNGNKLRSLNSDLKSQTPSSVMPGISTIGARENLNVVPNHISKPKTSKMMEIPKLPNPRTGNTESTETFTSFQNRPLRETIHQTPVKTSAWYHEAADRPPKKPSLLQPNSKLDAANEHFLLSMLTDVESLTDPEFREFKKLATRLVSSVLKS